MATITGTGEREAHEIELYTIDLADEEKAAFRAGPEAFVRQLLETQGHTVNGVLIDSSLLPNNDGDGNGDDWPCPVPLVTVHAVSGPLRSHWVLICPRPI